MWIGPQYCLFICFYFSIAQRERVKSNLNPTHMYIVLQYMGVVVYILFTVGLHVYWFKNGLFGYLSIILLIHPDLTIAYY